MEPTALELPLPPALARLQVRVASHVSHFWRAAAHEVLLQDTAVSRPTLDE